MELIMKQLLKEILKNRVYVLLMLLSSVFTSSLYYFVHFSADGNLERLDTFSVLSENQLLYRNGMISNTILAQNGILYLTALSCFVFVLFFYRFFRDNVRQLGCMKALGFCDAKLCGFFSAFAAVLSVIGAFIGYILGFFLSDVLIEASIQTYQVTGLIRKMDIDSMLIGFAVPSAAFSLCAYFSYGAIRGRESGMMIYGMGQRGSDKRLLAFADRIARLVPAGKRLPVRLAFRKPAALFLIAMSVICFLVMFLLGYSLTLSGQTVYDSQTEGHHYLYDTQFGVTEHVQVFEKDVLFYLHMEADIYQGDKGLTGDEALCRTVAGFSGNHALYTLMDEKKNRIPFPVGDEMVIGQELSEIHGYGIGDRVTVRIGENEQVYRVSAIAFNARSNWVYVSKDSLARFLSLPEDAFTGALSMENKFSGGEVTANEEKLDALMRGSVSNKSSAVINQVIGCMLGCILLYLALLLNFSDSTRDILILHLMGYQEKEIRRLLIDIYRPLIWIFFVITLWPSILIVKGVLKSLSIQIEDYLPFETNAIVIAGVFLLLNLLYYLVQSTFGIGIRRIIKKEYIAEYTN